MRKIWLVEDNDTIRDCLTRLLSLEGFQVDAFAKGETALTKASDNPADFWADLVFLDLYTEAMSASEFVRCLNSLAAQFRQRMPRICIISGAADVERISRMLNANSFFQKPFDLIDLVRYAKQTQIEPESGVLASVS